MVKRMLSALFIFLMVLTVITTVEAADDGESTEEIQTFEGATEDEEPQPTEDEEQSEKQSFSDRTAGMAQVKAIRYSIGKGTVRIVVDITKHVENKVMRLKEPSRLVLDLKDTWLDNTVDKTIEIKSTIAPQIRAAQFDKTTVRLVVSTDEEHKIFELDGGPAGRRLVIDLGTPEPEPPSKPAASSKTETPSKTAAPSKTETPSKTEPSSEPEPEKISEPSKKPLTVNEPEPSEDISKVPEGVPTLEPADQPEVDNPFELPSTLSEKDREKLLEKERKEQEKRERKERKEREKREKQLEKERREREKQLERERKEREKQSESTTDVGKPFSDDEVNRRLRSLTSLEGKKIAVDAGHGGNDAGAIGPSGVMEKTVTLRVALALEKLLKEEGAEVIMTRRDDVEVSPKGKAASAVEELKARCDVANKADVDIFISIHADSFTNPNARGTTGYYYSLGSSNSKRLADLIRKALIEQIRTPSRGTQPCNFYVVRNTDMPATLVELAFISNPDEEKLLNSKEGIMKAAQGILDGIEDYFG
ncbi:MAG: N-acetylmuramoyl-L-alanine amidase [Selenomonadaceae bacterium]|nr:N-acetylmuramoyl-L-alanine amidase [Selenomonadaceae bacterium]